MNDLHCNINLPSSGIITRIAVLAMLNLEPMHGYELRQALEARNIHRWANIQYGSIYRSLQQMAREGLLDEVREEREGNRPIRTVYRITPQGHAELLSLIRQAWLEPGMTSNPVDVALSLHILLPDEEIETLLKERLATLDELILQINNDEVRTRHYGDRVPPAGLVAVLEDLIFHRHMQLETERRWTEHVLNRLREGTYTVTATELEEMRKHRAQLHRRTSSP